MSSLRARDEGGLSLIELIIYILMLGILAAGIAMIFINTWKAQASVTDQTQAIGRGQLIASEIEKGMRNAVAFDVRDITGATSIDDTGPTLYIATDLPGDRACQVFSFTGSNAQMSLSASAIGAGPWTTWQSGITQHTTPAGTSLPYFDESGASVSYSFDVTSTNGPTVTFSGTAAMRNPTGGTQSCF